MSLVVTLNNSSIRPTQGLFRVRMSRARQPARTVHDTGQPPSSSSLGHRMAVTTSAMGPSALLSSTLIVLLIITLQPCLCHLSTSSTSSSNSSDSLQQDTQAQLSIYPAGTLPASAPASNHPHHHRSHHHHHLHSRQAHFKDHHHSIQSHPPAVVEQTSATIPPHELPAGHIDPYAVPAVVHHAHESSLPVDDSASTNREQDHHRSSAASDDQLLPFPNSGTDGGGGGGLAAAVGSDEDKLLKSKMLKFEEEPIDSYIVKSKSVLLRCRTLNALNAWFTCNSGDERRIQSNQKLSNYVDPQTGIRMIEIDLEVSRTDVEEHHQSGYKNVFQCWCTAYGGQRQIMSRKAAVTFAYLKKHFHTVPVNQLSAELGTQITFQCGPPSGHPMPTVFWMKNELIIVESHPRHHDPSPPINRKGKAQKKLLASSDGKKAKVAKVRRSPTLVAPDQSVIANNATSNDGQGNDEDYGEEEEDEEEEDEEDVDSSKASEETSDKPDDEGLLPISFGEDEVIGGNHQNYAMTGDHSLIIHRVGIEDAANYTCGARNVAGVRFSQPATLTIHMNGEWDEWQDWSPCTLLTPGTKCGKGKQKRIRQCSHPSLLGSKVSACQGESMQIIECNIPCSQAFPGAAVGGDGFWSPWSSWSSCSPECTQVRRRVCNAPSEYVSMGVTGNNGNADHHNTGSLASTGIHCFGPDFLLKNCTDGLCRLNDPLHGKSLSLPLPPSAAMDHNHEQIYFIIIFLLTVIILIFVLFLLGIKFNRKRHVKSIHGWSNMLEMDRTGPTSSEEQAGMLLLLQQQQQQQQGPNSHFQVGHQTMPLPPLPQLHQQGHLMSTTTSFQRQAHPHQLLTPEKYQLISRLNAGTGSQSVDHFMVRPPLNGNQGYPPNSGQVGNNYSSESGNSAVSSYSFNKYEEPVFANSKTIPQLLLPPPPTMPPPPPTNGSSPSSSSNHNQSGEVVSTGTVGSSLSSSASTTATTATVATHSGRSSDSDVHVISEPDYAEPIVEPSLYEHRHFARAHQQQAQHFKDYFSDSPSRSMSGKNCHKSFTRETGNSDPAIKSNHYKANPRVKQSLSNHEQLIQLTDKMIQQGHYSSAMFSLGVAVYFPPEMVNTLGMKTMDFNYGVHVQSPWPDRVSLSSAVFTSFPGAVCSLQRPYILCFKHCIANIAYGKAAKNQLVNANLSIWWQSEDPDSKWTEIIRYGHETLNTSCYMELDREHCYVITRRLGTFMLCTNEKASSIKIDKLVNFSLIIERKQVQVCIHDNLPVNTKVDRTELLGKNNDTHQLRVGNGKQSVLRVSSARTGPLYIEFQTSESKNSSQCIELPLEKLWNNNNELKCSFSLSPTGKTRNRNTFSSSDDSEICDEDDENMEEIDHFLSHKTPVLDMNFQVKIWQSCRGTVSSDSGSGANIVILNERTTTKVVVPPSSADNIHSLCPFETERNVMIRNSLINQLDAPLVVPSRRTKMDSGDWRSFAQECFDEMTIHYMPYFASQPSPSKCLFELCECKLMCEFVATHSPFRLQENNGYGTLNGHSLVSELEEYFNAKLAHTLKTIHREDLIDLMWMDA